MVATINVRPLVQIYVHTYSTMYTCTVQMPLHALQPWQARVLYGDSDYFYYSVIWGCGYLHIPLWRNCSVFKFWRRRCSHLVVSCKKKQFIDEKVIMWWTGGPGGAAGAGAESPQDNIVMSRWPGRSSRSRSSTTSRTRRCSRLSYTRRISSTHRSLGTINQLIFKFIYYHWNQLHCFFWNLYQSV